ncbi:MAG: ice-binding family protein [Bacteroidetes bacterium]|nr:ice-binding family protein [Bacteroidota bacterium]
MKKQLLILLTAAALLFFPKVNFGQTAPNLGKASTFSLFTAVGAFTCSSSSTIWGDIGTNKGAFTGSPALVGNKHVVDATSSQAAKDVDSAYTYLVGLTCDSVLTTLGSGQTLTPHVFCLGAATTLNGNLTLDAQGNPNAIFIIKIDGALSTGKFSNIILKNSASLCNVYWQVNGAVSLGDSSIFKGTIVANGAIDLLADAQLLGRGLSKAGAISLSSNMVAIGMKPITTITAGSATTICSGSSVTLTATVTNGVSPFTYSWNPGGSTASSITVSTTTTTSYIATTTAVNGCAPSKDTMIITVSPKTTITTAPTNQTVCSGNSVSFSVTASGSSLTYQWRKGSTNISGATASTFTINPATSTNAASNYNVIVSGTCSSDTSSNVSLTVNPKTTITTSPSSQSVCSGNSVSFSVTATGTALTYQWRKGSVNLVNGANISGATSDTLILKSVSASDAATNYNVVVSGTCSPAATSFNIILNVNTAPHITGGPYDMNACDSSIASFWVTATGTGLTYQWRKGNVNIADGGNISGAKTSIITFNPVTNADTGTKYNVVVRGSCSPNDTSHFVSIGVCRETAIDNNNSNAVKAVKIFPNPFTTSINFILTDAAQNNCTLRIYNVLGSEVMSTTVTKNLSTIETSNLPAGVYIYKIISNNKTLQIGRLVSQK